MKALAGFAVSAALASFAVGCDNHDSQTPLVDTTTVTGADLAARDAGAESLGRAAMESIGATPADRPVVRATPANGAYLAPQMQVSPPAMPAAQVPAATAPVATAPVATAPTAPVAPAPASTFVGSSFGPAPTTPAYVVPDSPPSDNHGNGTLGSSTGSHEFDTSGGNP